MAVTITSAPTNAAATGYSNQKHACTLSDGTLVAVVENNGTNAQFWYSQNGGTTWTQYTSGTSDIAGWANGSIASYVDSGGTERLVAVWKQSGTGGSRTDQQIYVMVGTFNAGRTTLAWGTTATVLATNIANYNYPDLVALAEGTGGYVHIVASYNDSGGSQYAVKAAYSISGTTLTLITAAGMEALSANEALNVPTWPSIDIDPSTKRLHVAWSAGTTGAGKGIRYRTASYSGGVWTWATEVEVDNARYVANNVLWINARWNSHDSMIVLVGQLYNGTNYDVYQYESTTFTTFTSRALLTALTGSDANAFFEGSAAIDQATGDTYIVGVNGGNTDTVAYRKWTRATTTLGARVEVDAASSNTPYPSSWYSNSTIRWVYTGGAVSPFSVKYDQLVLNTAPTIAYGASSLADASIINTATPTLTAYITDPDSSQTDTVTFDVATDSGFVTIIYTSTATAATPTSSTAVSKTTSALTKGVTLYWRSKVSDGIATSSYTATRSFTIYDNPTVSIGASTPATTVSSGGPTLNVGWTYAQAQSLAQANYRVQVQSNGGATTYYDTGTLAGATASVAIDAVANGIPTDTTGTALQVVVTVTSATSGFTASATKVFDIQWGVVTCTITSPANGAVIAATSLSPTWTFSSTRGFTQGYYRVQLLSAGSGASFYDSGFTASTASTMTVPVALVDGSSYTLIITLKNSNGVLSS